MKYTTKITICYIGIIILTSIVFLYYKNKKEKSTQEGLNIGKEIEKAFKKPLKPILDVVDKVKEVFAMVPKRFKALGNAFEKVGKGVGKIFMGIPAAAIVGANDVDGLSTSIGDYINKLFVQYVGPGIECGFQKIADFNYCAKFYFTNLIGETFYSLFIGLPIFTIKLFSGVDLEPPLTIIWDGVLCIDDFVFGAVGYHIVRWSDEIQDKCFLCNKMKPIPSAEPIKQKFTKLKQDFTYKIPDLLWSEPVNEFKSSGSDFKSFFS